MRCQPRQPRASEIQSPSPQARASLRTSPLLSTPAIQPLRHHLRRLRASQAQSLFPQAPAPLRMSPLPSTAPVRQPQRHRRRPLALTRMPHIPRPGHQPLLPRTLQAQEPRSQAPLHVLQIPLFRLLPPRVCRRLRRRIPGLTRASHIPPAPNPIRPSEVPPLRRIRRPLRVPTPVPHIRALQPLTRGA
jgi:hypothetical protein